MMKLFQRGVLRNFSCYKEVTKRTKDYKIVKGSALESASVDKVLNAKIRAAGPITVAEYMRTVLTNPLTGYYMKRDVFGRKGDFVTSPEVTQMFGEVIGVWLYHELRKIGMPRPWQIIELGPGRGTLMKDVLRVLSRLKALDDLTVHMVEVSPHLASIQAQVLCDDVINFGRMPEKTRENAFYRESETCEGCPAYWYAKIEDVPKSFAVVLAHEFFDALPIHKYQKTEEGWREVLIGSRSDADGRTVFEYALSKAETPISKLLISEDETREHLEISPESGAIVKHIGDRLEEEGGFALFVDYGHDGTKTDTFRAFKNHEVHDPLVEPGTADLTADVDFRFLKEIVKDKMLVFGPVEQGDFLARMGIEARLESLLEAAPEAEAKRLRAGYDMIVDKKQMGERYKVMALFPEVLREHLEKYPVAGFFDART